MKTWFTGAALMVACIILSTGGCAGVTPKVAVSVLHTPYEFEVEASKTTQSGVGFGGGIELAFRGPGGVLIEPCGLISYNYLETDTSDPYDPKAASTIVPAQFCVEMDTSDM